MTAIRCRAFYMAHAHDSIEEIMTRFRAHVSDDVAFDTLVGTGLSGALIVPRIAREIDCHYLIVRKPTDESHSGRPAEGMLGQRWLFVDDLVESGTTFQRVTDVVAQVLKTLGRERVWNSRTGKYGPTTYATSELVGAYLYDEERFTPADRLDSRGKEVYPEDQEDIEVLLNLTPANEAPALNVSGRKSAIIEYLLTEEAA